MGMPWEPRCRSLISISTSDVFPSSFVLLCGFWQPKVPKQCASLPETYQRPEHHIWHEWIPNIKFSLIRSCMDILARSSWSMEQRSSGSVVFESVRNRKKKITIDKDFTKTCKSRLNITENKRIILKFIVVAVRRIVWGEESDAVTTSRSLEQSAFTHCDICSGETEIEWVCTNAKMSFLKVKITVYNWFTAMDNSLHIDDYLVQIKSL